MFHNITHYFLNFYFILFYKLAQSNFENEKQTSDNHYYVILLQHWLRMGAISKVRSRCKSLKTTVHRSGRLLSWSVVRGALEQFSHNHTLTVHSLYVLERWNCVVLLEWSQFTINGAS